MVLVGRSISSGRISRERLETLGHTVRSNFCNIIRAFSCVAEYETIHNFIMTCDLVFLITHNNRRTAMLIFVFYFCNAIEFIFIVG